MQRHLSHLLVIAVSWTPALALAQTTPRPPKPYEPVAITRPPSTKDASLATFRAMLALVAKSRAYAELAPIVIADGFFWDRDFGRRYDSRRPAVDNLAAAISLEGGNGAGWNTLAGFAADTSAEPLESRPGVVCAPAPPSYDSLAFSRLLDVTDTDGPDWAYPRDDETPVRAAPQPHSAEIGMLGAHFIRLLDSDGDAVTGRRPWARIALPDGKTGYVASDRLISLTGVRLCYAKDLTDRWRIAGVIAAQTKPVPIENEPAK